MVDSSTIVSTVQHQFRTHGRPGRRRHHAGAKRLDILRGGALSLELTHHAIHLLGSRMLGFSQDLLDDRGSDRPDAAARDEAAADWAATLPHVIELARARERGRPPASGDRPRRRSARRHR